MNDNSDFQQYYSEPAFWKKCQRFAVAIGKEAIEKILIMYYCLKDPDTPKQHKTVILSALGYFILPIDLIPDFLIGGWTDDLGALAIAFAMVTRSIKQQHIKNAKAKLNKLATKS